LQRPISSADSVRRRDADSFLGISVKAFNLRLDPEPAEKEFALPNVRAFDISGRPMRG